MKAILFLSAFFFSCSSYAASLSTALTLNGLQWAQLTDTEYLHLPDVYAACGNSGGTCSGVAGGISLTGWRWATQNEVDTLISDFFGINYPPYSVTLETSEWFNYFDYTLRDGDYQFTIGISSDFVEMTDNGLYFSDIKSSTIVAMGVYDFIEDYIFTDTERPFIPWIGDERDFENALYPYGVFMVKGDYVPPSEIPLPASLFLFAPALLGLMGLRRKLS